MVWLLDANMLIALSDSEHDHFERAWTWLHSRRRFATSPVVQGALVRHLVRMGARPTSIKDSLDRLANSPNHEFWPDDLPYAGADLGRVIGHRQVTDAYLVALTRAHADAKLATMDVALAATYPDVVELIP